MTCDEAQVLVHALIDGELDASHARDVEAHAASCARCAAELAAARDLRQALRGNDLSHAAPLSLRRSIDRAVPSPAMTSRRAVLKGFAMGSVVSAAAAAGITLVVVRGDGDSRIMGEAVSAHLRSLQADHLTDVLSSDRHTVKPWFNGRIPQSPRVVDLGKDFPLVGGRIDVVGGTPVPTLVYGHGKHLISLTAVSAAGHANSAPTLSEEGGYNIVRWTEGEVTYWAVSDASAQELDKFAESFRATHQSQAPR